MSDEIEITLDVMRETEKAYLVSDGDTECWIPKSQVSDMELLRDTTYAVLMPEWLAHDKGLI